jgi:hypothetical protein
LVHLTIAQKSLGLNIAESDSDDNFLPLWWKGTAAFVAKAASVGELMHK